MRLSQVYISGFRCIDALEIDLNQFAALVGENSSGKSTILQAIDLLLADRVSVDELDFHRSTGNHADTIKIRGIFTDLNEHEQEQLSKVFGPVFETIELRRIITISESGRSSTTTYLQIPQAQNPLLNPGYISGSTKKEYQEAVEKGDLPESILGSDGKGNVGDLKVQIPVYIAEHRDEIDWGEPVEQEIKGSDLRELLNILPETLYVPAFDRITDHVTPKSTNILGKLLDKIFAEMEQDGNTEMARLNRILNNLTSKFEYKAGKDTRLPELVHLENKLSEFVQSVMPSSSVRLDFETPQLHDLLASHFEIKLDDGVVTPVDRKGHGAQRTMIWSLLRTYLEELSGRGDANVLFLVEEPELYLHPQAQRVMLDVLRRLSDYEQVIYSTHSSVFIDLSHPEEVRLIRKLQMTTQLDQISEYTLQYTPNETRLLTWVDDDRAELFFAKSVILVEGDTEKVLLGWMNQQRYEIDKKQRSLDELGCQVVVTDGKFAMPFYTSLLNDLKIPYFVIYDHDSSRGQHEETNGHVTNNVSRGRKQGLVTQEQVFHPFLEKDWGLGEVSEGKVDKMLGHLEEWFEKKEFPTSYTNLCESVYDFADSARKSPGT